MDLEEKARRERERESQNGVLQVAAFWSEERERERGTEKNRGTVKYY